MLSTIKSLFSLLMAVSLISGCSTLGQDTDNVLRKSAAYSLTTYGSVWQPSLAVYAKLPYCDTAISGPCKNRELYRKLYAADGAVASCVSQTLVAVQSQGLDISGLPQCLAKIEEAKTLISKSGAMQ